MPLFVKARSFLRNILLARRVESELDEELRSHLEMLTEENIRAGMAAQEARRAARIDCARRSCSNVRFGRSVRASW